MLSSASIANLLRRDVKPVLLLGAGASYRSGIPLASGLVDQIAKWTYCKAEDREFDDPGIMRSDWLRWLEHQSWYRPDLPHADQYATAVERLLRPQVNRREFFRTILRPGVPPSTGYVSLARLLARRSIRTVLTTNFDSLVVDTAGTLPEVHQIDEIRTADDQRLFSTNPTFPQVIYLHGSVNHYTDKNIEAETQRLDDRLVELLRPLLRDHPLVVVGYRGSEPSVMRHLLVEQATACADFRNGIYWCHLPAEGGFVPGRLLHELEQSARGNLQFVEVDGFDQLLGAVERSLAEVPAPPPEQASERQPRLAAQACHDLSASDIGIDALSEPLLRAKIVAYCDAQRLAQPDVADLDRLLSAMAERNLAMRLNGEWTVTRGAQLLFARDARWQLPQAQIVVTVSGPAVWVAAVLDQQAPAEAAQPDIDERLTIEGDLWTQLERASDLLARVNRPFRLKGPSSHDAYPYPPLALKELLTNLLAHRDYASLQPAVLEIRPSEIRLANPGGLVAIVQRQLDDEQLQSVVGVGARRVKGYRNPIIADFFFSAGAMDKEGSGLPDVVQEASNNLNEVTFGPTPDNRSFVATIKCRPEALAVDAASRTAKPQAGELRYSPNLLRIVRWPASISKLGTIENYRTIAKVEKQRAAPFCANGGWIWTFGTIDQPSVAPLLDLAIDEERHRVPTTELLTNREAAGSLPRLLNMALGEHLAGLGLRVKFEPGRIRAYFSADDGQPREISYRSQFKSARRTVAKPIVSRTTGATVYWEHKSVSLRFERFDDAWALSLLPSYMFTEDGDWKSIASERIGALTTRRAARDYNPTVLHDLVFWSRVISGTTEPTFEISVANAEAQHSRQTIELAAVVPTMVFQESIDASMAQAVDVDANEAELADLREQIEELLIEQGKTEEVADAAAPDR